MKRFIALLLALSMLSGCAVSDGTADLKPKQTVSTGLTVNTSASEVETDSGDAEEKPLQTVDSIAKYDTPAELSDGIVFDESFEDTVPDTENDADIDANTEEVHVAAEQREAARRIAERLRDTSDLDDGGLIEKTQELPVVTQGLITSVRAPEPSSPPSATPQPRQSGKAPQPTGTPLEIRIAKQEAAAASVDNDFFLTSVENAVLDLQNQERMKQGLAPLEMDENLRTSARIRSEELYRTDTFAHNRPDGRHWETVLYEDVPIVFTIAGENLAMKQYILKPESDDGQSAQFWFSRWYNSPTHYENMIRKEFTHAGVGVYYVRKGDKVFAYATTHYARYDPI